MRGLAGQRIVVCGAARGIGAAVASRLHSEGVRLLLADRDKAGLATFVSTLEDGDSIVVTGYEQGTVSSLETLVAQIDAWGPADGICIVSGAHPGLIAMERVTPDVLDVVHGVNVRGVTMLAAMMLTRFTAAGHGSLVAIGSVAGLRPEPADAIYASSKAALQAAMTSFSQEVAASGVRVNTVLPGVIDTPLFRGQLTRPDEMGKIASTIPAGRIGHAREVAAAVAFLLSDDASYITGAQLVVDGGLAVSHG
jgi:NAD(P)-dependent dehydrogenase (short-subunit alcohol dehydrogenase family)